MIWQNKTARLGLVLGTVMLGWLTGMGSVRTGEAATPGFVAAPSEFVKIPSRGGTSDPLQLANWWRSFGGLTDGTSLAPLTWSAEMAASSQNHVDYLAYLRSVGSTYCGHGIDPLYPPLSTAPRGHNVLFCGMAPAAAVDGWMATPLHGGMFVDPRATSMGLGYNASSGSAAGFSWATSAAGIGVYPAPGGVLPLLQWWGGEIPNPADACPPELGVKNGAPILTFLPPSSGGSYRTYRLLGWSLSDNFGRAVPACVMSGSQTVDVGGTAGASPYLFPKRPLVQGMGYRAMLEFQPLEVNGGVPVGAPVRVEWGFMAIDHHASSGRRLLDSRELGFGWLPLRQSYEVRVAGVYGIPINTAGAVLNVTVTKPDGVGFLTAWPCGSPKPLTSNLNYRAGESVPNLIVLRPGVDGKVCIDTSTPAHVVVDLEGWLPSTFTATVPIRVLETRVADGQVGYSGQRPAAGQVLQVDLPGDFARTDSAAVLNLTVTDPASDGFATVWPCDVERPRASNLNFERGQTRANAVVVRPGSNGRICIFVSAATHLIVDYSGSIDSGFEGQVPNRILDTRPGDERVGYTGSRPGEGSTTRLSLSRAGGVAGASAVVLNVAVTDPVSDGFVTVWPCAEERPVASNLNFARGQTVANLVMLSPGTGEVCIFTQRSTDLVVDLLGWQF